jgi:hypothetical protein
MVDASVWALSKTRNLNEMHGKLEIDAGQVFITALHIEHDPRRSKRVPTKYLELVIYH